MNPPIQTPFEMDLLYPRVPKMRRRVHHCIPARSQVGFYPIRPRFTARLH